MKLSKILILSLGMALCAGGAIGTAVAEISKAPATSNSSAVYDKAIYLYWGHESDTASLADMETLSTNVPQYRHLVVSPQSSKSVSGNVTVTFTLGTIAVQGKTAVSKGISVSVYEITPDNNFTEETIASYISGDPECVVTTAQPSGTAQFAIATSTEVHETVQHYAIKVVYDGSKMGDGEELSAKLTISQDFAA